MQTKEYLQYIATKIHSTVFATVDGEGRPVTCAIDIMDYDADGLYFLTTTPSTAADPVTSKRCTGRAKRTTALPNNEMICPITTRIKSLENPLFITAPPYSEFSLLHFFSVLCHSL